MTHLYLPTDARQRKLTHAQKLILLDAIREGLTHDEIATAFGISRGSVAYYADRHFTREERARFRHAAIAAGHRRRKDAKPCHSA